MAEEYGANIATKAGEGEANIWHWEGVQKTINSIYQRDLYRQKQVNDEYTKMQAQLSTSAKGLRAADIPLFQQHYDKYREAATQLMDSKVYRNADQRAYWSKIKDDSYANAMSVTARSEDAKKTLAQFDNNWMQGGGLNAAEDYHTKRDDLMHRNVDEIREGNLDNPMRFFNRKDDTPSELSKKILGSNKVIEESTPVYDPKNPKKVMAYDVNKYSVASEYPLGIVANNALTELHKSGSLTQAARDEFGHLQPEQAKTTIDAANQAILKTNPNAPPLPYDYVGYHTAKWVNMAGTRVDAGNKERKLDATWKLENEQAYGMKKLAISEAGSDRRANQSLAWQKQKYANTQAQLSKLFPDVDSTPIYQAIQNNDEGKLTEYMSAIAKNNPQKTVPVIISRKTLEDPIQANKLIASLGIADVPYNRVKDDAEQTVQSRIRAVIPAINKIAGTHINAEDILKGKVVPGLVHLGAMNEEDPKTGEYKRTTTTRQPVLFDQTSSPEELAGEVSGNYSKKSKAYLQIQNQDFEDIGGGAQATTRKKPGRKQSPIYAGGTKL